MQEILNMASAESSDLSGDVPSSRDPERSIGKLKTTEGTDSSLTTIE
jgi:hypothetical protein